MGRLFFQGKGGTGNCDNSDVELMKHLKAGKGKKEIIWEDDIMNNYDDEEE